MHLPAARLQSHRETLSQPRFQLFTLRQLTSTLTHIIHLILGQAIDQEHQHSSQLNQIVGVEERLIPNIAPESNFTALFSQRNCHSVLLGHTTGHAVRQVQRRIDAAQASGHTSNDAGRIQLTQRCVFIDIAGIGIGIRMRLRAMIAHVLPANLLQGMDDDIVYFLHYSV